MMSTDCEDTDTMLIDTKLTNKIIYLCYILGIGSILFGALSGNKYGHHFFVVGVLAIGKIS